MPIRRAGASPAAREAASAGLVAPNSPSKALLAYNGLRLLLLLVGLGIGYVAGLRGVLLVVVALAVSGVASWFLLKNQRIRMGMAVEQAVGRGRAVMEKRTAAEDEYVDAMLAQQAPVDDQPQP